MYINGPLQHGLNLHSYNAFQAMVNEKNFKKIIYSVGSGNKAEQAHG